MMQLELPEEILNQSEVFGPGLSKSALPNSLNHITINISNKILFFSKVIVVVFESSF